jgi:hypothetical protein
MNLPRVQFSILMMACLCWLVLALPVSGQDCVDYSQHLRWIGGLNLDGACNDLVLQDGLAYVATIQPDAGLQVVDMTDPQHPLLIGSLSLPGYTEAVAVAGNLAFTANLSQGVHIIDVSDPQSPAVLSVVLTGGNVRHVAPFGDYLAAVEWDTGLLKVIDVTDPLDPFICGSAQGADDIWSLRVFAGQAYTVWHTPSPGNAGLQVFDLGDPTQPFLASEVEVGDWARGLAVADGLAYVVGGSGLEIFDITDASGPQLVGSHERGGRNVAVGDGLAFLGNGPGQNGVWSLDVSDPMTPVLLGVIRTADEPRGIVVDGQHVVLANTYSGINVIEASVPVQPPEVNSLDELGSSLDLVMAGGRLYLTGYRFLRVVDLTDPTVPQLVGELATDGVISGLAVSGDFAYMLDDSTGLHVVDVSDPEAMQIAGHWGEPQTVKALACEGGRLFLTQADSLAPPASLRILDLSSPAFPEVIGSLPIPALVSKMVVVDSIVYLASNYGPDGPQLLLVDVGDPTAPQIMGSAPLPMAGITDLLVHGGHAYLSAYRQYVLVIDVTDSANPMAVGSALTPPGACLSLAGRGNHLYSGLYAAGLAVHDISDPANPVFLGQAYVGDRALSVAATEDFVFVGSPGRLQINYLQCDEDVLVLDPPQDELPPPAWAGLRLTNVAPNPFNPRTEIRFTVDADQDVQLTVFDAAGRRVARLVHGPIMAGEYAVVWDGRDVRGRACPSGVYLVELKGRDRIESRKLTLTR